MGAKQQFTAPYTPEENPTERAKKDGENNDCAVRRAKPKKLGRKTAGNHAGSKHERFRIHRLHTVDHYPRQRTKTTEPPIRQRDRRDRTTDWDPGGEGQQTQGNLRDCKAKSGESLPGSGELKQHQRENTSERLQQAMYPKQH